MELTDVHLLDELKSGATIAAVVPIPEPATVALLGVGAAL